MSMAPWRSATGRIVAGLHDRMSPASLGCVPRWDGIFSGVTPRKTSRSPESQWLEDVFPIEIVPC